MHPAAGLLSRAEGERAHQPEDRRRGLRQESAEHQVRERQKRPGNLAFGENPDVLKAVLPGVQAQGVALRGPGRRGLKLRQRPEGLPEGVRGGGDQEEGLPAYPPAQLRHPPAGAGRGPALHPGLTGALLQQDHGELHPHHPQGDGEDKEPTGQIRNMTISSLGNI